MTLKTLKDIEELKSKYLIKAGDVNERFREMKKKMIKDLEEFRMQIVQELLVKKIKEKK